MQKTVERFGFMSFEDAYGYLKRLADRNFEGSGVVSSGRRRVEIAIKLMNPGSDFLSVGVNTHGQNSDQEETYLMDPKTGVYRHYLYLSEFPVTTTLLGARTRFTKHPREGQTDVPREQQQQQAIELANTIKGSIIFL